ncbi:MAG: flagellar biosynthesis protein FlgI [Gammaproteobacteria bacterium SG8_11]|nr:MAG: flagellar biosynthesis protein FlgI [Gammaproteobacteria bacterium SG8_11]
MVHSMSVALRLIATIVLSAGFISCANAERLKDMTSIAGVRDNQLIGYGLVVGLDGTGDKTAFTIQSLRTMLTKLGVTVPPDVDLKSKNVAAVSLHAELPAFAKPGQRIDVTVSSIGEAKSLRGGTLLLSPLKGADGNIYAIAQGNIIVGGFGVSGGDGSKITVNVPSVGRVPGGAMVERSVPTPFATGNSLILNLHTPDFTTANRVVEAINASFGAGTAVAMDGSSIKVLAPLDVSQRVAYVSELENIVVQPADAAAKVIINSRTGTVVIGNHVTVTPAAVTHGSLTVTISERPQISQPEPFSQGETAVVPQSEIEVAQENQRMFLFESGTNLEEIVRAINQVGAAPGDLVAILEALKEAGALRANLIVI